MRRQLDKILRPQSLAIVGASGREGSVGFALLHNMKEAGFEGALYPVNPKRGEVQQIKAYKSVADIPTRVDLCVICTPAKTVPAIVEECGKAGVGGLIIISAGFAEAGAEGKRMFNQISETCRHYGMRVIGPNCLGLISPPMKVNASFAAKMARSGNLALISQSGALLTSILDWSVDQKVGFSNFVSIGSMMDIDFTDLIDYFGTDEHTSCILIYMESLKDAHRFMSAARAFSRNKPIIVLKAGRSEEGGKATMSHTGSLAGNDAVYDAAFRRAGTIRVDTIAQLFNIAQALAMQPRPLGNRLAIVTNAGGPGVLSTDFLIRRGGKLAELSEKSMKTLDGFLPPAWSHNNPIDVLGDAGADKYEKAVRVCLQDTGVDGVLVILTPQSMTYPVEIAQGVVKAAAGARKPVFAAWMGESDVQQGREVLETGRVPNYRYPESAVDAFVRMFHYNEDLKLLYEAPPAIPVDFEINREKALEIIERVYEENRSILLEAEAKDLMGCYGIPVSRNKVCGTPEEAIAFADSIGYPVVMKIASRDISHKTDAGGVILNVRNSEDVHRRYEEIISNVRSYKADARIDGILVEKMITGGHELLIGAIKDPIFGPVIVFGRGGVAVEVFKDTKMGLPPLNLALANRLIQNIQMYPLLEGYRGMPGADLEELALVLYKFSYLLVDFPQIKEVDINPFVADEHGGLVLDARVALDMDARENVRNYKHLVITPYPGRQYSKTTSIKDAPSVFLRPIRPEDEPALENMLLDVSADSMYMRFFGYIPKVTHQWLTRFTHIDYDREIAIVAEVGQEGEREMIGVVRLIEDAWRETAEYSILVADKWQGKGLGNQLTDYIIEIARQRGIRKIVASVLPANTNMIHMFENRGFKFDRSDMEIFDVELELEGIAQNK